MLASLNYTTPSFTTKRFTPFSPLPIIKSSTTNTPFSHQKPLHISTTTQNLTTFHHNHLKTTKCNAYEADRTRPFDIINIDDVLFEQFAQRIKIGLYFASWWALNVVFNIYNKKVLNAFPYPWLTSTLSLACGSLMMLVSWGTRIADPPKTDFQFWKTLFPVSNCSLYITIHYETM